MPAPADAPARTGVTDAHPDPAFPRFHARPATGWLNDPNGVGRVDGRYHVFFQHNPSSARHDAIVWGHLSSPDLLHWREEPIAIAPRPGAPDARGCWSGCLTDDAGVPTLVYSGVAGADGGVSDVLLARSDRTLREWTRDEPPAVGRPGDPAVTDVRDPFVFAFDGRRYAVQGAGARAGTPRVLLYDASDLTAWRPLGDLVDPADPVAAEQAPADIWECPNLVPLGDRWVLVLSLWTTVGADGFHLGGVRHLLGDLVADADGHPRFVPERGGLLDTGPTFYAPQLFTDGDPQRVLVWGWAWEHGRSEEEIDEAGWAGVLTFPREVEVDRDAAGGLRVVPARELTALRGATLDPAAPVTAASFEVVVAGTGEAALHLAHPDAAVQEVLRWRLGAAPARVLVDGSVVEAFGVGGLPHTTRAYPRPGSTWRLEAPGATTVRAWELAVRRREVDRGAVRGA